MPKKTKPRQLTLVTKLMTIIAGLDATNDLKLAKVKGDHEMERIYHAYGEALGDIQAILEEVEDGLS